MLFYATRVIVWIGIVSIVILKIKVSNIKNKKMTLIMGVLLSLIAVSVTSMFPIENFFFKQDLPEEVFKYAHVGKVEEIIYGQESCLIVYSERTGEEGHYIVPKVDDRYEIPNYFATKVVAHEFTENGFLEVYNVRGTEDYYIFGAVHFEEGKNKLTLYNGKGEKVNSDIVRRGNSSFIYCYSNGFSEDYYLMVNAEKVQFH